MYSIGEQIPNMSNKARRNNKTKERPSLGVPMADKLAARRWTKGAEKYTIRDDCGSIIEDGSFNWKKGSDTTDLIDSLKRHITAIESGEDIDRDFSDEINKKYGPSTHYDAVRVNSDMLFDQYYRNFPDNRIKGFVNKRIAVDLDGVISDLMDIEKSYYYNYGDYRFLNEYAKWLEDDDLILNTKLTSEAHTMNFEPVAYITARPESIKRQTLQWIENNNLPAAPVVFTNNKVQACKDYMVELFVEDHYENFVQLNNAGIKCLLMDRSYNRKYNVGYLRIYNLKLL